MFKALGDPVRLRLFSLIASHPLNRSGWEATKPAECIRTDGLNGDQLDEV